MEKKPKVDWNMNLNLRNKQQNLNRMRKKRMKKKRMKKKRTKK